jgi:hypothetical protein
VASPSVYLSRFVCSVRGLYRVFNPAVYRFYWGTSPPAEGDTPDATSATLPYSPSATFSGTGTWYFSASYFNGALDSGFLPVGPNGATSLRLDLAADVETGGPPAAPLDVRLEARAGGVVRILALYVEASANRADEWAIPYTVDGSTPAEDAPDISREITASGPAVLQEDLPAVADGTTVKVRVQTRRNDGTEASPDWVYSDGSTVLTITADAVGPGAPLDAETWPGQLPAEGDE